MKTRHWTRPIALFAQLCALLTLAALARAQPGHAQGHASADEGSAPHSASAEGTTTAPDPPGASVVTEHEDAATGVSASERAMARAKPLIARAEALFAAENYEAALAELQRAYDELEGHPQRFQTLYNMGLCHERLFRYGRALELFERYLTEGAERVEDRSEVEATMKALRGLLGTLRIATNVPAEVWVDDVLIGSAPGELFVAGGRHTVELRADGYQAAQREVQVAARSSAVLEISLRPINRSEGLPPALFWTGLGLTALGAGVGISFGVSASALSDEAMTRERDAVDALRNHSGSREDIEDHSRIANVLFAASGVLALGTTLLFVLTDWDDDAEAAPAAALMPTLQAGERGASLGLRGRF